MAQRAGRGCRVKTSGCRRGTEWNGPSQNLGGLCAHWPFGWHPLYRPVWEPLRSRWKTECSLLRWAQNSANFSNLSPPLPFHFQSTLPPAPAAPFPKLTRSLAVTYCSYVANALVLLWFIVEPCFFLLGKNAVGRAWFGVIHGDWRLNLVVLFSCEHVWDYWLNIIWVFSHSLSPGEGHLK